MYHELRNWGTHRISRRGGTGGSRLDKENRKIHLSQVFAGQILGLREIDDQIWLVSFLNHDIGFFDNDNNRVEPAQTLSPRRKCKPSLRY